MDLEKEKQQLDQMLGLLYSFKNGCDRKKANEDLLSLGITNTSMKNKDTYTITLRHPGKLIGVKGRTIDVIQSLLGVNVLIEEDRSDPYAYILLKV